MESAGHPTTTSHDAGLWALVVLARFHGIPTEPDQIRQRAGIGGLRFSEADILLAARALHLKARSVTARVERLPKLALPCIALDDDGNHFVIARADAAQVMIQDSRETSPQIMPVEALTTRWSGRVILIASRASLVGELQRFDFSWFITAVVKYRHLLLEVLGVSLALQLFALVTPLFFQVVMDKVLVHRGLTTLEVICIALLVCSVVEVVLTGLRNYVFSHTTNRIDVELGARLFRHLLNLPLPYFMARRVGDTVARVRELENIRNFLTGQALTAVIDVLFSLVFLAVMCVYSVKLTAIVVLSLPCYALVSFLMVPVLRARLDEKFARGADNQSFLVETITGIETVKAMAVEPQFTRRWDQQLASYIRASFRVSSLANLCQQAIQLIGKFVTLATLWLGARLVIDGRLSVGQLVAFNMLAGHVASPVLRLAQLWPDFQQVGISMQRLGDILNVRTEIPQGRQALPHVRGDIVFEDIRFRYQPNGPHVLKGVTFAIAAGEVIGIVGRSGSGKSTLTKLLQRLYLPEGGRIRIDGIDLALAEPAWLRRQVGVVLQENLLFNRTIRENIALIDPAQPLDSVIAAARLAGAHDFIVEFPQGYETVIGEHGAGLSGGQRQRIAIARALMGNPRILILDEATSALDYESERAIQDNMHAICAGRTVLVIAHRLSAVRRADRIIAMDEGRIVETGTHDMLVAQGGYYARLAELQAA